MGWGWVGSGLAEQMDGIGFGADGGGKKDPLPSLSASWKTLKSKIKNGGRGAIIIKIVFLNSMMC